MSLRKSALAILLVGGCYEPLDEHDKPASELHDCDGGKLDPSTGLCWQDPPPETALSWNEPSEYCDDLSWGGHSDWRLPTLSELRSLIRGCPDMETGGACNASDSCLEMECNDESCDGCSNLEGPHIGGCYWDPALNGSCNQVFVSSSFLPGNDSYIWSISFASGVISHNDWSWERSVRCVRNN